MLFITQYFSKCVFWISFWAISVCPWVGCHFLFLTFPKRKIFFKLLLRSKVHFFFFFLARDVSLKILACKHNLLWFMNYKNYSTWKSMRGKKNNSNWYPLLFCCKTYWMKCYDSNSKDKDTNLIIRKTSS